MSKIGELKRLSFKSVGVNRDRLSLARHFYDIHIQDEGILGLFIWRRNTMRIPIISHIRDMMLKSKYNGMTTDEILKNDFNFFIPFKNIRGVVSFREHKEFQILSSDEEIYIYFRPFADFDLFLKELKGKLSEKVFQRDNVKILHSLYQ